MGIKQSLRKEDSTEERFDVLVTKVPLSLTTEQKALIDRLRPGIRQVVEQYC